MSKRRLGLLLFAFLLLPARFAAAESMEAKQRTARRLCLSGDFAKGVAILSDLFVRTKNPTFIYNQGRCFEQNRRYEDAIARFQEYLRAGKKLSDEEKADAEKHIADCKDLLAGPKPVAPATPVVAPAAAAPLAPVAAAPPPVPLQPTPFAQPLLVQQTAAPPKGGSGAGLRTVGIITAAVGGAALVAGVILNLKVNSLADDINKTNGYSSSKVSDRNSYETLGWVSYGVGAACVATGAVLYFLGLRSAAAPQVALVPAFAPGQAGALVKGAF